MNTWESMSDYDREQMRGARRDEGGRHLPYRILREGILKPCEGSGGKGHVLWYGGMRGLMCEMCGQSFVPKVGEVVVPIHDRKDIIAMIHRGDFDGNE